MDARVYYHNLFLYVDKWKSERFLQEFERPRARDPLSPNLFVVGMEVFSILVDKVAQESFPMGYKIVNREGEEVQITHLLFANDKLVFCKDSKE